MEKIGIVTLSTWEPNYGQRLQLFALQQTLKKLGYVPEMIQDARWSKNPLSVKDQLKNIIHSITSFRYIPQKHGMQSALFFWSKRHVAISKFVVNKDSDLDLLDSCYDYFITGSDQVWNPYFTDRGGNSFTFLQFADPSKRISYAPSFACKKMLTSRVEEYKDYLKDFPYISVREENAVDIVMNLTGRQVPVVLDPTLLFTGDEWKNMLNVHKTVRPKYVFAFLYGEYTTEFLDYASNFAASKNAQLVCFKDLVDLRDFMPDSWFSFINDAEYVITNSFHCTIFSILFHKRFVVVRNPEVEIKMGARVMNLLQKLEIPNDDVSAEYSLIDNVDWDNVENILIESRKKSINYLMSALQCK